MLWHPSSRKLVFVGCVTLAFLAIAPSAFAANFTVNDLGDAGDASPGTGGCATAGAVCTLRAAVDEANHANNPGLDTIGSSVTGTIDLGSEIDIDDEVTIDGCSATPNSATPCVGVRRGHAVLPALDVNNGASSTTTIRGLAITDSGDGINNNAIGLQVQNNWFGVELNGTTVDGNSTAIRTFSSATVGGTAGAPGNAPATRNVFAGNTTVMVVIGGADDTTITGNYIGTMPDGTTAAGNTNGIQVHGNVAADVPDGTVIGGTVSNAAAATAACDGACNVIAATTNAGIDLVPPGTNFPTDGLTIAGNHIGLNATGTAAAGNDGVGVEVAEADNVTVGGATANDRNVIGGNGSGISTSPNSLGLVVRNNFIGLNSAGTAAVPDDVRGAVLSGGTFADNRLGGSATNPTDHGVFLDTGVPHVVTGNVFGVGTGGQALGLPGIAIDVGSDATIGGDSLAEANTIANTRGAGSDAIRVKSGVSTISGNILDANQGAGITIDNAASNNVIGGDTAEEENLISNSGRDAIRIGSGNNNLIDRNRGTGNGTGPNDLFIDLGGANGPGNGAGGPNNAVEGPSVGTATTTSATGTAEPNAVVRVFRQDISDPGRVDAFVGMTSADGAGDWQLVFPAAQPGGSFLVATQTQFGTQNTSELSPSRLVPAPPAAASGGGDGTTTGGSGGSTGTGSSFLPGAVVLPTIAARQTALSRDLAELAAALRKLGIDGLLKKRGATIEADSLLGGALELEGLIDGLRASATATVLSGKRSFSAAGKARVQVKLTREGRRILTRRRRARLRLRGTFTDTAKAAAISSARTTVARKKRKRR